MKLELAGVDDIAELVAMRTRVNQDLAKKFGEGFWVGKPAEGGERFLMRIGQVYVARHRGRVIATLTLTKRKPWSIDVKNFPSRVRPMYLRAMVVDPARQRKGVGSKCMDEARRIARAGGFDSIRLDAFDCAAGAGDFYRKCGFTEVARVIYKGVPHIYFEIML